MNELGRRRQKSLLGDLIWQIGTGYFGCRNQAGQFDPERFSERATWDVVKMIEIKISQGAKPGHGGILPAAKITPEIAEIRGVPLGEDIVSPYARRTGLKVTKVLSGPKGGDAQIAAMAAEGKLDAVFFFRDPLDKHPHEPDIQMLMRVCDVHNIPLATNPATAELVISSLIQSQTIVFCHE